jgi:4-hydroxythreonine-4-phosphate dehydrogenase
VSLPVAVSFGDPWGIGPEIAAVALLEWDGASEDVCIFGARASFDSLLGQYPRLEKFNPSFHSVFDGPLEGAPGQPPARGGRLVLDTLAASVDCMRQKKARALVTAPVNKALIHEVDPNFIGHTEYLGGHFGVPEPTMTFVSPRLVTALVTTHAAIGVLASLITEERVLLHLRRLAGWVRAAQGESASIAVTGLNPHAGEGGAFGNEEEAAIRPAILRARAEGIHADGPWPADSIYREALAGKYAAVLAMYHDQALVLFKVIDNGEGVNMTLGLPFIRTSPDHGTAYTLAGSGQADHRSMIAAIRLAHRARI